MSMWQRISLIFRSKANKALDRAEDPRETLDYSYQRQLDLLAQVRRGVADVATSRKRVELQVNQLQAQSDKLTAQAEKALGMGREDLAREALTRKSGARGLRAIMEAIMLDVMYDVPSHPEIEEVVISQEVVENREKPIVVYAAASRAG